MNEQEKGVLDRAAGSARRCREDATLFREAAERMRDYAYGSDECGDAAEDPEAAPIHKAMQKASGIASRTAREIEAQMPSLPGYVEWFGDPVADTLKAFGLPEESDDN